MATTKCFYAERDMHVERLTAIEGDIALLEQRGELAGETGETGLTGLQEHVGESRMHRKLGHRVAVLRDDAVLVDGLELQQQLPGVRERRLGRTVEPGD